MTFLRNMLTGLFVLTILPFACLVIAWVILSAAMAALFDTFASPYRKEAPHNT